MDAGTQRKLAATANQAIARVRRESAKQRPDAADVAAAWLAHAQARDAHEAQGPVLASRDEAYQRLALDHFAARFDVDPGVAGDALAKVHAALAPSLDAAPSRDADALLDCMAGWYLTADGRYRKAVADALAR